MGYQGVAHNRISARLRTTRLRRVPAKIALSVASRLVAASEEILIESIALRFRVLSDVGKA
jgi:hypothetical protein